MGGSTCVEASYDCYYTSVINKEVTCLTLTDTLGRQCLVGTNGKCKAKPIICAEAINATSQEFCYTYQSNCRWLGGSTCVEAK